MAKTKLKPCPFCGSEELESRIGFIYCRNCGAEGPIFAIGGKCRNAREEAIAAWNKREGDNDAEELCAKLNRLAALEAVCREVIEKGAEVKGKSSPTFTDGVLTAEWAIAQKLKAVLEEK